MSSFGLITAWIPHVAIWNQWQYLQLASPPFIVFFCTRQIISCATAPPPIRNTEIFSEIIESFCPRPAS